MTGTICAGLRAGNQAVQEARFAGAQNQHAGRPAPAWGGLAKGNQSVQQAEASVFSQAKGNQSVQQAKVTQAGPGPQGAWGRPQGFATSFRRSGSGHGIPPLPPSPPPPPSFLG